MFEIEDYQLAIQILRDIQLICESSECDNNLKAKVFYNIAFCYNLQSRNHDAINYLHECFALNKDNNLNLQVQGQIHYLYASSMMALGNLRDVNYHLEQGLLLAVQINDKQLRSYIYSKLSNYWELMGELNLSLEYNRKYTSLKDSLFNESLAKGINNVQQQLIRREAKAIIAEKDSQLERSRIIIYLTVVVILLSLFIIWLLIRNAISNRKAKNELQQKVRERTKDLTRRNEELAQANKQYDHLIYRSSHEIRGPISSLIGLTNLAKYEIEQGIEPKGILTYLQNIEHLGKGLTDVLEKFLIIDEVRNKEIKASYVNLEDMIKSLFTLFSVEFPDRVFSFSKKIEETEISCDPYMMKTVVENLLKNAFFFHNEDSSYKSIEVKLSKFKSNYILEVSDSGVGINEGTERYIYDLFYVASEFHGNGLGLFLAKTASERLGGKIILKNHKKPTVFQFKFPVPLIDASK